MLEVSMKNTIKNEQQQRCDLANYLSAIVANALTLEVYIQCINSDLYLTLHQNLGSNITLSIAF